MAGGQVGRLSVRVLPDTTQFRRDLKKAMERAEKSVAPVMSISLRVTKKSLAEVKRQLQGLEATVPVSAELSKETQKRVQEQLDSLDAEATVDAELDTASASARMKTFTRPRMLPIHVNISKSSLTKATAAIAALSGARLLRNFGRGIKDAVANLDQALPALAAGTTAIAALGGAGLAATSNLFALGASLASIAPAALVLPGLFAGFGVGIAASVIGIADLVEKLDDLGPAFTQIQRDMGDAFSDRAEGPIRELAQNLLPVLSDRLTEVSSELGGFFGSMANALNTDTNIGYINGILANTRDSIDIAAEGIANFTDGLLNLTNAGSAYLEPLAAAFNRMSEDFNEWVAANTENGQLFEWIDSGIAAFQDLGRVVWGLGGVFSNFATAASAAGGASLGSLADGLERVNAVMEGPAFQGALTTVFQGAHDAMAALGPGFSALGDAFVSFAPVLAQVLTLAGQIGSVLLTGIAAALESPAFQDGLTSFFEGILIGVEAILPHMPALAAAFGAVASFAGTLASVLGPVLGAAIEALAPVVTDLMEGLGPVAEVLGGVLVSAIQTVAPFIQDLVSRISEWVQENPEFAAGLLVAAAAVGGLVAAVVPLIGALVPVIASIISIVAGLTGLGVTIGSVAGFIGGFLAILLSVVAGIAALAGAFLYAWTQSAAFRESVMGLFEAVMGLLQPIIAFIQTTVIPVVMQVAQAFIGMVTQVLAALVPMWTVVNQIFTEIIRILTPVVTFILSVLAPVFTFLGNVVSAAFTFIGTVISSAINIVTAILQVFLAMLRGDWSAAWEAVKNVGRVVWESIKTIIAAAITFVWSVITSALSMIRSIWNTVWSAVRDFVVSLWQTIVARVRAFIVNLVKTIRTKVDEIRSKIQTGFNTAKQKAIQAFRDLVRGVKDKISELLDRVRDIPGDIKSGLGNLANLLYEAGKDVIRGLIDGIKNMAGGAVDAAKGVVDDAVQGAKNVLGIASPSKVFREIGEYTGEGMIIGLESRARGVNDAMESMVKAPSADIQDSPNGATSDASRADADLLGALSRMKIVTQIGNREFYGAVVDAAKANRRSLVTKGV